MQVAVFGQQALPLEGLGHRQLDFVGFEGLGDVVVSPGAQRLYGAFDGAIGGDHDDRQSGIEGLDFLEQFQAVHARHLNVGDHQVEIFSADVLQGLITRAYRHRFITILGQHPAKQSPHSLFVIDDKNLFSGHLSSLPDHLLNTLVLHSRYFWVAIPFGSWHRSPRPQDGCNKNIKSINF